MYNRVNTGNSDTGTLNSNRSAAILYFLGTWFVSGIYVSILCMKEITLMMMMITIIII
jgi:hypothetical protein